MSTRFAAVQGDIGDTIVAELDGVSDFTASTVVANVWVPGGTPAALAATVANATSADGTACGRCTVYLGVSSLGWLSTALGTYAIEYVVTFSDGTSLTWPEDAPDVLVVRADA